MKLQGHLLVATPQLESTPFRYAVILVSEHDEYGAQGYVLNKPSLVTVEHLFEHLGVASPGALLDQLYLGGPVSERSIHMIHSSEWHSSSTMPVSTSISVSRDSFMFDKMEMQNFPDDWQMFAGFSSWGRGQLETEISRNDWMTLPATHELVFASKKSRLWDICIELCGKQMINSYF